VHLKKLDWMDLCVKFSSELLVVVLALLVGIFNIFFFAGHKNFADDSHAAKLLSYHTNFNPKLYGKLTSINTVVVSQNGILPSAQASDFVGLSADGAQSDAASSESDQLITDGSLGKPANITTAELVAKQIKVYETKSGDTLKSIADANGISQQTIIWANNLPSTVIKPGWQLVILPTDGIMVKATANDTLPDIAARYSPEHYNPDKTVRDNAADKLLEKIISYNGLQNAEDIDGGQIVIVPGRVIATPRGP